MKHFIIAIIIATFFSPAALGLDVTTSAGRLHEAVGSDTGIGSLTIKGTVDASDFDFIRTTLGDLRTLDMSGVTVVAYSGEALASGRKSSPEGELPEFALFGMELTDVVLPSKLKSLGMGSLGATSVTKINLPESLGQIGDYAFAGSALAQVTVPQGVVSLGQGAFKDCLSLSQATLSQTSMPEEVFSGCVSLAEVTMKNKVESVADKAFAGCKALTSFEFGDALSSIGDDAFAQSGLTSAPLARCGSLVYMGRRAFERCESLKTVSLPESLDRLPESAFLGCGLIESFETGAGIESIERFSMARMKSAAVIDMSQTNVSDIGEYAMSGLSSVTDVKLPSTLFYIGSNAMEEMSSLQNIEAPGLRFVPELGENVWSGVETSKVRLTVDNSVADMFRGADQWREFDIRGVAGVDNVIGDDQTAAVTARFSGYDLRVASTVDMAEVSLYDTTGRRFVVVSPNSNEIIIDTADWLCHLYIIKVTLADGTIKSLKLARR